MAVAKFLTIILKILTKKGSDTMYSFRRLAKMTAEERAEFQKNPFKYIIENPITNDDDDDSSVDSVNSSETLVDVPF